MKSLMHMCFLQRLGATIFINRDFVKWFQLFDSTFFGRIYGVIMMVCMHAKLLQLCLVLCNPMDCSPSGSLVHGILQARLLMWIAMPSSRGSSWPRDRTCIPYSSCIAGWFFTSEPPGRPSPVYISFNFLSFFFFFWLNRVLVAVCELLTVACRI